MLFSLRCKLRRRGVRRGGGQAPDQVGTDAKVPAQNGRARREALAAMMARPDDEVRVILERSGSALLVSATGSVDAANVSVWRRLVGEAAAITAAPGPLIVDTSKLDFIGICGFAALAEEASGCRRRGVALCLVSSQPIVARVVKAVGLEGQLSFCATLGEALGDTRSAGPGPVQGSSA